MFHTQKYLLYPAPPLSSPTVNNPNKDQPPFKLSFVKINGLFSHPLKLFEGGGGVAEGGNFCSIIQG